MKGVTALISVITAITLVFILPKALKLPSPAQLDREVRDRLYAYEELKMIQKSLVEANELLEQRVTERTEELVKQKNIYAMLSSTNQAIVRITDQDTLFREICRIIVDVGQFKFVWISKLDQQTKEIVPIYKYGDDACYVDKLKLSLNDAVHGPTVSAYLSGTPFISNDFLNDTNTMPWHESARLAGVAGSGVFPIKNTGEVVYTFNLYAGKVGCFKELLMPTLQEMSEDVSFALENYRKEQDRQFQAEVLRDLNRDFISFLDVASDYIYFKDADNRFRFCSRTLAEMVGLKDWRDMIGKKDFDVFDEELAKIYRTEEAVIFEQGLSIKNKVNPFIHESGYNGWVETNKWPLFDDAGKVVGLFGISRDITEYKRMEDELRAAAERFRGLVEQSIAGIYIIQDELLTYCNERFAEIFGYASAKDLIGRSPLVIVDDQDAGLVGEKIRLLSSREEHKYYYSFNGIRKDGSKIIAGVHGSLATYLGRPAVIGLLQDISEKKQDEEKIARYILQLQEAFMNTVQVAMTLSEMRDPYTAGHERRVAELSVAISTELGFDANRQQGMRVAGYLHDIGKITIPAEILSKPGKLSEVEYTLIKQHARSGYDVLKDVEFPWPVAEVALQHHERIDGSGYPQGLKGNEIAFEARILAVADTVESMSTHRPYRPALGIEKALEEIERGRGIIYDQLVVDACVKLFRDKNYTIPD
jgi:PAS domain S-box-containing protein/putative nucleotidyltransferase with HDIG domain